MLDRVPTWHRQRHLNVVEGKKIQGVSCQRAHVGELELENYDENVVLMFSYDISLERESGHTIMVTISGQGLTISEISPGRCDLFSIS